MSKEIRKDVSGEKEEIFEDGVKVGEITRETNLFGHEVDVVRDTYGHRKSETVYVPSFPGETGITRDAVTGERLSESHIDTSFGDTIIDDESAGYVGRLVREGTSKILHEYPGCDVDLTKRALRGRESRDYGGGYNGNRAGGGYSSTTNTSPLGFIFGLAIFILIVIVIMSFLMSAWSSYSKYQEAHTEHFLFSFPIDVSTFRHYPLPNTIQDGDWFPDQSKIVFSKKEYYREKSYLTTEEYSRHKLYLQNSDNTQIYKIIDENQLENLNIDNEYLLAPLVSPNGNKIAFVVDRYDHPGAIYIMNKDGTNIRRVSKWSSSLAYTWISDNLILCWQSDYDYFNFDLSVLSSDKKGRYYLYNTDTGVQQETQSNISNILAGKFISITGTSQKDWTRVVDMLSDPYVNSRVNFRYNG